MDNLYWFKFSPADWFMGRVQRCSEVTQARFIRLICVYWNNECDMSVENAEIETGEKEFKELVRLKIVEVDGDAIAIKFLDKQYKDCASVSNKRSEAAKARWSKAKGKQDNANALQDYADKIRVEENREEKIREDRESNSAPTKIDILNYTKSALASIAASLPDSECKKIAKSFYDYYGSQGWRKANGMPITDYKLAVSQWVTKEMNSKRKEWKAPEKVNYDPPREIQSAMSDLAKKMKG